MTLRSLLLSLSVLLSYFACTAQAAETSKDKESDSDKTAEPLPHEEILRRVRRQESSPTPKWVNAIPDRIADILISKHMCRDSTVWGLAKAQPNDKLPWDEVGTARFVGLVKQYDLFDQVGELDEEARLKALGHWQSWQNPETGRFEDPRDTSRVVNEKYVVSVIGSLGGEPLYPWTTTGDSKKIETKVFLERTLSDPDWEQGGWGVGSHTGLMAVEIFRAINEGQTELIPDLETGMNRILSHQDPKSGLWGPPDAHPVPRIGGALKVIGRFYFAMGTEVPHTRELADTLIGYHDKGLWFKHGQDSCVPRNVAEVVAYCIEVSDYRREELHGVLDGLVEDYKHWVRPDGSTLFHRDDPEDIGLQFTTHYGLGIIGAYLNWEDCRLENPLTGSRGVGYRYRPVVQPDGRVKVIDTQATSIREIGPETPSSTR